MRTERKIVPADGTTHGHVEDRCECCGGLLRVTLARFLDGGNRCEECDWGRQLSIGAPNYAVRKTAGPADDMPLYVNPHVVAVF